MTKENIVREVVGIFKNYEDMENAIDELEISGFSRHHISVLGSQKAVKETFGDSRVNAELLADNPDVPRSPDIKKEEMGLGQGILVSGGMVAGVASAIIASGGVAAPGIITTIAVGGAGGTAVGAVLAKLLGDKYSEFFQNQIDNGGLVLWVNSPKIGMEIKAEEIMKKYGAEDIHVHEIPVNTSEASSKNSKIFGEAFVKLDHLIDKYEETIDKNNTLNKKIFNLHEQLKNAANSDHIVPKNNINKMSCELHEIILLAQDMGKEEQKMTEENMPITGNEENLDSEKYFSIANDLIKLEEEKLFA
ncbi:hypothetical protein N9W34_03470 [Rickettsiales bacterium]|nr:hypothetical protein [Rickettsiales bacterium]